MKTRVHGADEVLVLSDDRGNRAILPLPGLLEAGKVLLVLELVRHGLPREDALSDRRDVVLQPLGNAVHVARLQGDSNAP